MAQKQDKRDRAAELFAQGKSNAEVVQATRSSRQAVSEWRQIWEEKGREGLILQKPGPKPRLNAEQWEQITEDLKAGPRAQGYDTEFWSLERIAALIEQRTRVSYHPCHVWRLMQQLNWTYQKPETQAKQRNEGEILRWKEQEWPRIKRGRKSRQPR